MRSAIRARKIDQEPMTTRLSGATALLSLALSWGCTREPSSSSAEVTSSMKEAVTAWATDYCELRDAACNVVRNDAYVAHCVALAQLWAGCCTGSSCECSLVVQLKPVEDCLDPVCGQEARPECLPYGVP